MIIGLKSNTIVIYYTKFFLKLWLPVTRYDVAASACESPAW